MSTQTGGRKADGHSALTGGDPGKKSEEDDSSEDGEPRTWHKMRRVREHQTSIVRGGPGNKVPYNQGCRKRGEPNSRLPLVLMPLAREFGWSRLVGCKIRQDRPESELEGFAG